MSQLIVPGTTHVYVNWGVWIADCAYCLGAAVVPKFASHFTCDECQNKIGVVWPSEDMVASVERLLLMRPLRQNQNWVPSESVHDLLQENAEHGVLALHAQGLAEGTMIAAVGDRLTVDNMRVVNPRRELVR